MRGATGPIGHNGKREMNRMIAAPKKFPVLLWVVLLFSLPGLNVAVASGTGLGSGPNAGHWVHTGGPATGALDILIDPIEPKVVYAATGANYVLKSLDAGVSWTPEHQ